MGRRNPAKNTLLRLLMIATLYGYADSYKAGAPEYSCKTMTPSHGSLPQSSTSPYAVIADNAVDSSARSVKVSIRPIYNDPFTGYLLQARSPTGEDAFGTFIKIPEDSSTLNCSYNRNSAITHRNNLSKRSVQAVWEAPPEYEGNVVFRATVVRNFSTYWTEILSLPVRIARAAGSVSEDSRKLTAIQDALYEGCGTTKQCLGSRDNCIANRDCTAIATIAPSEGNYFIELMSKSGVYVAVGLSNDTLMGNDAVFDCVHEANNEVGIYRSWNVPGRKHSEHLPEQTDFNRVNRLYIDGTIYCKIRVNPVIYVYDLKFDLNTDQYYIMLAAGSELKSNGVGYHNLARATSRDRRQLSDFKQEQEVYDPFYEGCGILKNCFGSPPGCVKNMNCRAVTSVSVQGNTYIFQMQGLNTKYVATGLSDDTQMGEDSVAECVHDDDNKIKAYFSWNIPNDKNNVRIRPQNVVTFDSGSYIDGKLQCTIKHATDYEVRGKVFNLTKTSYVLLLAAGSSLKPVSEVDDGGVGYHDLVFTASAEKRSLADVAEFSAASKLLLHLHGSFMIVAWIGTASLGIILARYFKQTWIGSSLCGKDIWFAWHRFFMVITWILTLASVIIMYIDVGGFVTGPSQTHALLGTITTVLAFIQPIGAAFRPHPDSSRRPIFNWLHWFMGNAAHIIAIVTIFLAVDLAKAGLPKWTDILLAIYVGVYVVIHLILSISGCMSDKSGGIRINSFPMKDINPARNQPHQYERRKDAAYSGFRKFILFVYLLAVTAVCVLFILLITRGRII